MSKCEMVTALRVATVPEDEFERQVDSDKPPAVTELARQGTTTRPEDRPRGDRADALPHSEDL